jgi:hypothetical protein
VEPTGASTHDLLHHLLLLLHDSLSSPASSPAAGGANVAPPTLFSLSVGLPPFPITAACATSVRDDGHLQDPHHLLPVTSASVSTGEVDGKQVGGAIGCIGRTQLRRSSGDGDGDDGIDLRRRRGPGGRRRTGGRRTRVREMRTRARTTDAARKRKINP